MRPSLARTRHTHTARKARGAFFTPEAIASFVVDWAIRSAADTVLEPSCGEAAFLTHAVAALRAIDPEKHPRVDGVEIHGPSASEARRLVVEAGGEPSIREGDFFLTEPTGSYSAVIGNPPYIRYQDFSGEARTRSREAALRAGVNLSGLASSWAAFTVHAALMLRKGGRLGLVIPAELLSVNYAGEVRRFLLDRFTKIDLVLFTERVFSEAQEDVVLLLADGFDEGSAKHMSIYQAQNAAGLSNTLAASTWSPRDPSDKWTPSLLGAQALAAYGSLAESSFTTLHTWGETTLGMVTGNNRYFTMSPQDAADRGLPRSELLKLSPPPGPAAAAASGNPATSHPADLAATGPSVSARLPRAEAQAAARELAATGASARKIARQTGWSRPAVQTWLTA